MKKVHLTLLVLMAVSGLVLICGVSLAADMRININPTLEECRQIPKFEYLFEVAPDWVLVRNRKCIEMEKNVKGGLEAVRSSLATKK